MLAKIRQTLSALTGCDGPVKATAMGAGPSQRDLLSVGRLIT